MKKTETSNLVHGIKQADSCHLPLKKIRITDYAHLKSLLLAKVVNQYVGSSLEVYYLVLGQRNFVPVASELEKEPKPIATDVEETNDKKKGKKGRKRKNGNTSTNEKQTETKNGNETGEKEDIDEKLLAMFVKGEDIDKYMNEIHQKSEYFDLITDILLVEQTATGASVNVPAEVVATIRDQLKNTDNYVLGWGHSHGTMSAFSSGTDDDNHINILNQTSNIKQYNNQQVKFSYGITVNAHGDYMGKVATQYPCGAIMSRESEWEIVETDLAFDEKRIGQELTEDVKKKVKRVTYTYTKQTKNWGSNTKFDYWQNWNKPTKQTTLDGNQIIDVVPDSRADDLEIMRGKAPTLEALVKSFKKWVNAKIKRKTKNLNKNKKQDVKQEIIQEEYKVAKVADYVREALLNWFVTQFNIKFSQSDYNKYVKKQDTELNFYPETQDPSEIENMEKLEKEINDPRNLFGLSNEEMQDLEQYMLEREATGTLPPYERPDNEEEILNNVLTITKEEQKEEEEEEKKQEKDMDGYDTESCQYIS